jgi:short-subunit dehydrogenase involved in D-alanine esterification of teichoic acids
MQIVITGHTSGIGKALFDYFTNQGHRCIGFSRSTGHDISDSNARKQILLESNDCDIFINNAYKNFDDSQLHMLEEIYNLWQGQSKLIINMSSRVTEFNKVDYPQYRSTKLNQDIFCRGKPFNPQILNLKLGLTDTPRVEFITDKQKMTTNDIIKMIDFVLENKDTFKITSITAGL